MMVKPTVATLLKRANNRYELVIATSKRARQIAAGATPFVNIEEKSPVTIAANEIAEGKVNIVREGEQEDEQEILDEEENNEENQEIIDETEGE